MIFIRQTLIMILCLTLAIPLPAIAAVNQRSPEDMMSLVSEYINEVRSEKTDSVFLLSGRDEFLAKAVISQITTLEPEDFNLFLLHLMSRYVNSPDQRPYLFSLINLLRESIATDLDNTAQLREGPAHNIVSGAYTYAAWILLGYAGVRFAAARTARGVEVLRELRQREIQLTGNNRLYKVGFKVASNPLIWSAAAGAGLGYMEYLLENSRTHRLDPSQILMVIQSQLACHLSYKALEVEDQFEQLRNDDEKLKANAKNLTEKIDDITAQTTVLEKQFSRLQNLDVKDRLFQKTLSQFPQSKDWAQFRSSLSEAETSKDGQCRQMSLIHVNLELTKTKATLESKAAQ